MLAGVFEISISIRQYHTIMMQRQCICSFCDELSKIDEGVYIANHHSLVSTTVWTVSQFGYYPMVVFHELSNFRYSRWPCFHINHYATVVFCP